MKRIPTGNDGAMSTAGQHLVATPRMLDPNFSRTVVFMIEHTNDGALGVVLNRPSELPVAGTIDEWASLAAKPGVVFAGGPVSTRSVITLACAQASIDSPHYQPIPLGLGTVDVGVSPNKVSGVLAVRMFAGYAGWGPGQLDAELRQDTWQIVDAIPHDVHTAAPEELWWTVLGRQPAPLGYLRLYPHNLEDN